MKIYKQVKKFHPDSGKAITKTVLNELRCDYTGNVIDIEANQMYCSYELNYSDSDPCFGSGGDEYKFGQTHLINMFEFLSGSYHFLQDYERFLFPEKEMMRKYLKNLPELYLPEGMCFHDMCRTVRVITASKLIEDGIITPAQLTIGAAYYDILKEEPFQTCTQCGFRHSGGTCMDS